MPSLHSSSSCPGARASGADIGGAAAGPTAAAPTGNVLAAFMPAAERRLRSVSGQGQGTVQSNLQNGGGGGKRPAVVRPLVGCGRTLPSPPPAELQVNAG